MLGYCFTVFLSCSGGGGGGDGAGGDGREDEVLNFSLNCPDVDGDGYTAAECGGTDCDDRNPDVNPMMAEICGDGIDQNCYGGDSSCDSGAVAHANLKWDGSQGVCLSCHEKEARDMYASTHYQWQGDALYMSGGPQKQGKIAGAVNSYCINILGNWTGCGSCHVGLGDLPSTAKSPTDAQLENVDCLICHQKEYRRIKIGDKLVPDTQAMNVTLEEAVRTVHLPEKYNCLVCHAKAGGGDAVKRGDLAMASAHTADYEYDVHMSVAGGDLRCQECHIFRDHRFAGKGSDIRPTDLDIPLACSACHTGKANGNGHSSSKIDKHVDRVACQTCHIPYYAKNAADSAASEATEIHRTWLNTSSTAAPFHPASIKANNLIPAYRFWNRYSDNYLLGDIAAYDRETGGFPTSRPEGFIDDSSTDTKLYPFKYKTAEQPILDSTDQLVALDTKVFFQTADPDLATTEGLKKMGYLGSEHYSWITTDTFQLLNHQISPASRALDCSDCHGKTARMDLKREFGYHLKDSISRVCTQCHGQEEKKDFEDLHEEHVKDEKFDCSHCHIFSRPERKLRKQR